MILTIENVKSILDFLIKDAYSDLYNEETLNNFYNYTFSMTDEADIENKNVMGRYFYFLRKIEIYSLHKHSCQAYTIKTCIHELAHHIAYLLYRDPEHDEKFYNEYGRLLKSAIKYRLLRKENIYNCATADDSMQVHEIIRYMEEDFDSWVKYYEEHQEMFTEEDIFPTELDILLAANEAIFPITDDWDGTDAGDLNEYLHINEEYEKKEREAKEKLLKRGYFLIEM